MVNVQEGIIIQLWCGDWEGRGFLIMPVRTSKHHHTWESRQLTQWIQRGKKIPLSKTCHSLCLRISVSEYSISFRGTLLPREGSQTSWATGNNQCLFDGSFLHMYLTLHHIFLRHPRTQRPMRTDFNLGPLHSFLKECKESDCYTAPCVSSKGKGTFSSMGSIIIWGFLRASDRTASAKETVSLCIKLKLLPLGYSTGSQNSHEG